MIELGVKQGRGGDELETNQRTANELSVQCESRKCELSNPIGWDRIIVLLYQLLEQNVGV